MTRPAITSATLEHLRITPKTIWSFVQLSTDDGHVGFGEASLPNRPAAVLEAANTWLADIVGRPAAVAGALTRLESEATPPRAPRARITSTTQKPRRPSSLRLFLTSFNSGPT